MLKYLHLSKKHGHAGSGSLSKRSKQTLALASLLDIRHGRQVSQCQIGHVRPLHYVAPRPLVRRPADRVQTINGVCDKGEVRILQGVADGVFEWGGVPAEVHMRTEQHRQLRLVIRTHPGLRADVGEVAGVVVPMSNAVVLEALTAHNGQLSVLIPVLFLEQMTDYVVKVAGHQK